MLAGAVSGLVAIATFSTAEAVFGVPSPNGPGRPQAECCIEGLGNGPHEFSNYGFQSAETHYAGSHVNLHFNIQIATRQFHNTVLHVFRRLISGV